MITIIVDHSGVVGTLPFGAAPNTYTSSFSTQHPASIDCAKTTARRERNNYVLGLVRLILPL